GRPGFGVVVDATVDEPGADVVDVAVQHVENPCGLATRPTERMLRLRGTSTSTAFATRGHHATRSCTRDPAQPARRRRWPGADRAHAGGGAPDAADAR